MNGGICDSCDQWTDLLIPFYGQRYCDPCAWSQSPGVDIRISDGLRSYMINTKDAVMAEPKVARR